MCLLISYTRYHRWNIPRSPNKLPSPAPLDCGASSRAISCAICCLVALLPASRCATPPVRPSDCGSPAAAPRSSTPCACSTAPSSSRARCGCTTATRGPGCCCARPAGPLLGYGSASWLRASLLATSPPCPLQPLPTPSRQTSLYYYTPAGTRKCQLAVSKLLDG